MNRNKTYWYLIPVVTLVSIGCLTSCETHYAQKALRENPLHKDNVLAGEKTPIDGVWNDGYRVQRIDRGRMYFSIKNKGKHYAFGYDTYWPMVSMGDIVRVAPGRYRAKYLGKTNKLDRPCTLTVVSDEKIALKYSDKIDQFLTRVDLDNEKWFLDDLNQFRQQSIASRTQSPSIEIQEVSTDPVVVPQGQPFDLRVAYTINDPNTNDSTLPVEFSYVVKQGDEILFKSRPQLATSPNGRPTERIVHLKGAIDKGAYIIEVLLTRDGLRETQAANLFISE
jgi:hypothetical protein